MGHPRSSRSRRGRRGRGPASGRRRCGPPRRSRARRARAGTWRGPPCRPRRRRRRGARRGGARAGRRGEEAWRRLPAAGEEWSGRDRGLGNCSGSLDFSGTARTGGVYGWLRSSNWEGRKPSFFLFCSWWQLRTGDVQPSLTNEHTDRWV
jgi:hypothetical protein